MIITCICAIRGNSRVAGFTLIEILVILGIVSLLSSGLFFYSKTGERQLLLFKEQARLLGIITRAKSLSLGAYGESEVPCGYGVHFEPPRTIFLYKDLDSDCEASTGVYTGGPERIETFVLDQKIRFVNLAVTDILFVPPNPSVLIIPQDQEAVIMLGTQSGDSRAVLRLTSSGQITTQ